MIPYTGQVESFHSNSMHHDSLMGVRRYSRYPMRGYLRETLSLRAALVGRILWNRSEVLIVK